MASIRLLLSRRTAQMVTQLIRTNMKSCCPQKSSPKPICYELRNKCLINLNKKCLFHTSDKRYNPLVAIVLRQAAKFVALLTGRAVRKWWREMPSNKRQLVINWLSRHKLRIGLAFVSMILLFYVYYLSHLKETPITRRKRFIAFNTKQMKELNKYEFEVQLDVLKDKLLPNSHPMSRRVAAVATQLLNKNNDLQQIHENEWTVSVVNDDTVKNAFVLPSGQIFVFTGMLALCDSDQQLGVVLAHEMAHAVLGHGAELVSHAHLIDMFFICIIGLVWALLPTDMTATISTAISKLIISVVLDTPYSRMLETEADIVGLELAAKACFDVRESSAFWHKMSIIESSEGIQFTSDDIKIPVKTEFLSTHPSHESRYQYLDTLMEDAIRLRNGCHCPPLPKTDPRHAIDFLKKKIEEFNKTQRSEGVFVLPKPPVPPHLQKSS